MRSSGSAAAESFDHHDHVQRKNQHTRELILHERSGSRSVSDSRTVRGSPAKRELQ